LAGDFNLMVLDVNLPDVSGIEVMHRIRANDKAKALPVLMLTAMDRLEHKVKGLDSGADDYLTKPFDFQELLARLRALARRQSDGTADMLRCGDIELSRSGHIARKAGMPLLLTARELRVLTRLMEHAGHIVSKSEIEEELYGWEEGTESNTVEVIIYNLRKKLGRNAIATLRGVGYMMRP